MAPYISRPLAKTILETHSPVVILEGARAVGKTSLAKKELCDKGFSYYTLADDVELDRAGNDVASWVSSLRLPAIVDEAQRLPGLPLAVKERVDLASSQDAQFVLTGSASLGRDGLSGQNPLTRRSRTYTLNPFTQRELLSREAAKSSIVDLLWHGEPNMGYRRSMSKEGMFARLSTGGFPRYSLSSKFMSERERGYSIREDIDNTLGESVLPGEHLDKTIAEDLLQTVLALPGSILNVSAVAEDLGYNNRTVTRYLSIFQSRFLVRYLPNLRARPSKQSFARSKVHPVDASFSIAMLQRSGRDILGKDSSLFGGVLESFVVNQIIPEIEWSQERPDYFYWREPGAHPKEVDLVLLSGNELIGVEVKSGSRVRPQDLVGLRALSQDPRFKRGFVIYMGDSFEDFGNGIWAMPIAALWDTGAFNAPEKENGERNPMPEISHNEHPEEHPSAEMQVDASIFLSYCREDNEYLDGAITDFAKAIARAYRHLYGNRLDVFIDTESIRWGEDWKQELSRRIESTNFIMPAITPSYIRSDACRKELIEFAGRTKDMRNSRVLALIWKDINTDASALSHDPVLKIVKDHQWMSAEGIADLDPKSREYKKHAEKLAESLHGTICQIAEQPAKTTEKADCEERDLLGALASVQGSMPEFMDAFNGLATRVGSISEAIQEHPLPRGVDPKGISAWCVQIEQATKKDVSRLEGDLDAASAKWDAFYDPLRIYATVLMHLPDSDFKTSSLQSFESQLLPLRQAVSTAQGSQDAAAMVGLFRSLSPRLKPVADAYDKVLKFASGITAAVEDLVDQVRSA